MVKKAARVWCVLRREVSAPDKIWNSPGPSPDSALIHIAAAELYKFRGETELFQGCFRAGPRAVAGLFQVQPGNRPG